MCINLMQIVCTDCRTQEAYVPYMKKTSIVCDSCYEQLSKLTVYLMHQSPFTAVDDVTNYSCNREVYLNPTIKSCLAWLYY